MAQHTEREVLEHLVETCRDGERGFLAAAQHVRAPELKALFTELAEQRQRFARDLEPHVNRLGGSTATDGTSAGAVHRGWINIKARVSGHDDNAIVTEAERGDHVALIAYDDALNGMLPPTAISLVEAQRDELRAAHQRMRAVACDPSLG